MTKILHKTLLPKSKQIRPQICLKAERLDTYSKSVRHNTEKITKKSIKQSYRTQKYLNRKTAQSLRTNKEIKEKIYSSSYSCGYARMNQFPTIKQTAKNQYHFENVIHCQNIHRCPTCSERILKQRGKEIYRLTSAHLKTDKKLGFITLTQKHSKKDSLSKTLNQINSSWRKIQNHTFFKNIKKESLFLGQIKSLEITNTQKNGWHPHLHIIIFWNTNSEKEVEKLQKQIIQKWTKYTGNSENAQDQKIIYSNGEISDYITKWTASQELTGQNYKNSKGINPFQLLPLTKSNEIHFNAKTIKQSQQISKSLWLEYVEATKGKRRITTSPKLNKLYKVKEKTEEEIFEEKIQGSKIIQFSYQTFKIIANNTLQPYIIKICEDNRKTKIIQRKIVQFLSEFEQINVSRTTKNIKMIHLTSELN